MKRPSLTQFVNRRSASPRPWVNGGVLLAVLAAGIFAATRNAQAFDFQDGRQSGGAVEVAQQQLLLATQSVENARQTAKIARQELDDFVVQHFSEYRTPSAPELPRPSEVATRPRPMTSATYERLTAQLQQLTARREELLENFTESHPEVAFVKRRILEVSRRLSALSSKAGETSDAGPALGANEEQSPANQPSAESPAGVAINEQRQKDSQQYDRLFDRWQFAERELTAALAVEAAARERLATIQATTEQVAINSAVPMPVQSIDWQPWIMVALLIALAVAALAAARMSKSNSSDAVFSSVDEISAALALPVMGVIPAARSTGARAQASSVSRGTVIVCQLVLAAVVFALVACMVQNPTFFWQLCTDPAEGLRGAARFFGR